MGRQTTGARHDAAAWRRTATAVDAPDFAVPWLDRFYDADDVRLIGALGDAERPTSDVHAQFPDISLDDLRRAHRRAVVDLSPDESTVVVAPFSERFEPWITFEGWKDLPPDIRARLVAWDHDAYVEEVRDDVADLVAGRTPKNATGNDSFILLREAQDIVRAAGRLFVRPCSCRRIHGDCGKPVDVCIWIDEDDRGAGWEISRERALELLHEADVAGLMFTANTPEAAKATWICCCCADCCAPILAAEKLGVAHAWPLRRFLAVVDDGVCTRCRTCVERCPFGALTMEGKGQDDALLFDEAACRGCGVCATGCEQGAIAMAGR
jgi:Pyruvate/2-oxoacid:ferredoxin oxidoreductase delta subunit